MTPERRKPVLRSVLSGIGVTPTPEGLRVDIQWVDGSHTVRDIATVQHLRDVIRDRYAAGCTDREIAESLQAAGFVERRGPHAGQPLTQARVAVRIRDLRLQQPFTRQADALIAAMSEAGVFVRVIATELNAQGIRHRCGIWTASRVETVRQRLRLTRSTGKCPRPGAPPLTERIRDLARQGVRPGQIAQTCRSEGYRTARRHLVTDTTVRECLRSAGPDHAIWRESRAAQAHVATWGTSATDAEMAQRLNALGLPTKLGTPWTPRRVQVVRLGLRIKRPPHRGSAPRPGQTPDGTP